MRKIVCFLCVVLFTFPGCKTGKVKRTLPGAIYVGNYYDSSPLFVFTSWGKGVIVPNTSVSDYNTIDSLVISENCIPFETDMTLVEDKYLLLGYDGKYALASFKGDFKKSSYCFYEKLNPISPNTIWESTPQDKFRMKVYEWPSVIEQCKAFIKNKLFHKEVSGRWGNVYYQIATNSERSVLKKGYPLSYIQRRPKKEQYATYAIVVIEKPIVYEDKSLNGIGYIFDQDILKSYSQDIVLCDYKNYFAFYLKGTNELVGGKVIFEENGGRIVQFDKPQSLFVKLFYNDKRPICDIFVEPTMGNNEAQCLPNDELYTKLLTTLDSYLKSNIRENIIESGNECESNSYLYVY